MRKNLHHFKFMTFTSLVLMVISVLNLQAQDYLINFAGSGGSTTVTKVKVENLTQGKSLEIDGSDALHLMGIVTGIETFSNKETGKIDFYPNPMKDFARMQFDLPEPGETLITMHDLSGRKIAQTRDLLQKGQHTYVIQDVKEGIYFIRIISGSYSFNGSFISSGSQNLNAKIVYENTGSAIASQEKQSDSKGIKTEIIMQYTTGDRLKITGISGIFSTVVTDVPAATKTITFNFIACTDGDDNNYPIVQIGTTKGTTNNPDPSEVKSVQIWMAENIRTTKYNGGTAIPEIIDNTAWESLTTGAYCNYNNTPANSTTHGRLYNWYAVNTGNLCPTGWHVPSNDEWTTLRTFLGGETVAGGKLKETGTTHWASPNAGATNETGFNALPGGDRTPTGRYEGFGIVSIWWSSTESWRDYEAYAWGVAYNHASLKYLSTLRKDGISVRCVKNN